MNKIIYFDNNSTTHMLPSTREFLHKVIDSELGNPESLDILGKSARASVEESRTIIADFLSTSPKKIIFTSSGSESNTVAIHSAIKQNPKKEIVCSQIEHTSINKALELLSTEDFKIKYIKTLSSGIIDLEHAKSLISNNTALICLQLVNNETGVIQPVNKIAKLAKNAGALLHCDGAQAFGKLPVNINKIDCDYFSFTAHKFHGPKGIGGLWTRQNMDSIYPLIPGGSQEFGVRGGTHNLLGILGMGHAAGLRKKKLQQVLKHTKQLRDLFEQTLTSECDGIQINGYNAPRIGNTSNILFNEIDGKALFINLLQQNIICSQTSACTSQYPEPSKVLRAMGLTYDQAFNSIRFSFSELNSIQEISIATEFIIKTYKSIKNILGSGW